MTGRGRRWPYAAALLLGAAVLGTAACGGEGGDGGGGEPEPLAIGAIPDQDPERLQRLYGSLADYLEERLEVPVEYAPVTDYAAAVTAFRVGDLELVWFGGLTGVQARLQVPGAEAIAQRGIDEDFHSVFIAHPSAGLDSITEPEGLDALRGHSFTFGSESSTSGRLMPQYHLEEAGVSLSDFRGQPGFSGSHDRTIALVASGTYEVGALNEQVWRQRVAEGAVDTSRVRVVWRTPAYYDYHWVLHPAAEARYGPGLAERVREALTSLDGDDAREREILDLFGAERFIPTRNENYERIEEVGRRIGRIR